MTTSPIPTLETERLRLRPWRDDDLDAYVALCGDPEVMRWIGARGAALTPNESADQLAGFRQRWSDEGFGLWCAAPLETDECIGFVGFAVPRFLPEILPCVEIGWRLAQSSWGQGYATEGARRVRGTSRSAHSGSSGSSASPGPRTAGPGTSCRSWA